MSRAKVTSKGQITLPKRVREALHLVPGDRVEFVVEDEGRVVLRASRRTAGELEGMLCHYAKENPVSVEEMDQAIAREAARGDWA